jgi:hypothetical protein
MAKEVKLNIKNEIKVIFKNTYIGKLGNYIKGNIYIIPVEIYNYLSMDCEEV